MNDETKIVDSGGDYKDVSGLLEEDVSKVESGTDEKISEGDKIDTGDKIELVKPIPIKPIRAPKFATMRTMAEYSIPTPITRKEMYLYVIAGGVWVLPTPITREEIYLAKICGMDVEIPIPLTRYEMYLYKLAGGEWDVPTPVTRLEIFLYHNLGFEVETPEPVTREEIYWNGGQPQPTTIEGIPPLTFTAKRTGNLEDYTIYGNTIQSGTPTPDSPIEPEFCGDLVSIELDEPLRAVGGYKDTLDLGTKTYTKRIQELVLTGKELISRYSTNIFFVKVSTTQAPLSNGNTCLSNEYKYATGGLYGLRTTDMSVQAALSESSSGRNVSVHDSNFDVADDLNSYLAQQYVNGTPVKVWYVLAEPIVTTLSSIPDGLTGVIEGTVTQSGTPTPDNPIEPVFKGDLQPNGKYQVYKTYKIPISSGGQTKNIYLGQVPTTRRIKKLVLTGEEDIRFTPASSDEFRNVFYFYGRLLDPYTGNTAIGTHFENFDGYYAAIPYRMPNNNFGLRGYGQIAWYFSVASNDFNSLEEFVAYLKEQYNSGTPFTIWYVLATPEVGIVNEPLAKIGDYVDSVDFSQAGVEIPTITGTNTLSVGTTVQPSNMSITYK